MTFPRSRDRTAPALRAEIEERVAGRDFAGAALAARELLGLVRGTPRLWQRLARLHAQAGQLTESLEAVRRGVAAFPDDRALALERWKREAEALRRRRALYAERDAARAGLRAFDLAALDASELMTLVQIAAALPDIAFGRQAFERALSLVGTTRLAQRLLWSASVFFERVEAGAIYAALLARADALDGSAAERLNLRLTLLFALRSRARFLDAFDAAADDPALDPRFGTIARRWRTNLAKLLAEPRVIGIGLPKTGTTSLAAAMTELGFFHADHHCPLTNQFLVAEDVMFFDSVSDSLAAHSFELLDRLFPNARFVLTERPEASWRESYMNHNLTYHGVPAFDRSEQGFAAAATVSRHGVNQKLMYFATSLNAASYESAYAEHQARVDAFFGDKQDKLLRFDLFAGDGWDKLCGFLGRPVPATDFPHRNPAQPLFDEA